MQFLRKSIIRGAHMRIPQQAQPVLRENSVPSIWREKFPLQMSAPCTGTGSKCKYSGNACRVTVDKCPRRTRCWTTQNHSCECECTS
jgi:hypothetical protein